MQTNLLSAEKLVGVQEPRLRLLPSDFDPQQSADRADDMIGVAELSGLYLDPWQQIGAEALTLARADGRWAGFEAFVAANRQQGKGTIIEARQLAGLFVWEESLQIYTAHEFKTAQEMFLRIRQLVESAPDLDRLVSRVRTADGEEAIETKNGCRLKFMARSNSSGRGFTAPTLYLDEAMKLKQRMLASLMPTMSALSLTGNPQMMYFSSAGEIDSDVQAEIRDRALAGKSGRLIYVEWSVPAWDELPTDKRSQWTSPAEYRADPEVHRRANPGYNIRLDPEFVMNTELETMGPEEFDRERLGIWAKLGGGGIIPIGSWADSAGDALTIETETRELGRVAFAVDIPRSRDSASIVMAGELPDGRTSIILIDRRVGTDWVAERLAELKAQYNPVAIVIDELAATGTLVGELRRLRIRVWAVKYREYMRACGALFDAISQLKIAHTSQQELNDAVAGAGRKDGESTLWKWAASSSVDISPLVAATLAFAGLHRRSGKSPEGGQRKLIVMGR